MNTKVWIIIGIVIFIIITLYLYSGSSEFSLVYDSIGYKYGREAYTTVYNGNKILVLYDTMLVYDEDTMYRNKIASDISRLNTAVHRAGDNYFNADAYEFSLDTKILYEIGYSSDSNLNFAHKLNSWVFWKIN